MCMLFIHSNGAVNFISLKFIVETAFVVMWLCFIFYSFIKKYTKWNIVMVKGYTLNNFWVTIRTSYIYPCVYVMIKIYMKDFFMIQPQIMRYNIRIVSINFSNFITIMKVQRSWNITKTFSTLYTHISFRIMMFLETIA